MTNPALQDYLDQKALQLQKQVVMNQQLMKRKEDMEWQLMSVLAQVAACSHQVTVRNLSAQ